MKRLISLLLIALICISLLFVVPVSAVNGAGLWYDKTGNNVKITVKGIESTSAILLVGKYQSKKMISSENYPITNHNGTYTLSNVPMEEGFEYRFFVWEGIANVKPLFECLSLSTKTEDGVGSTKDNGVKSVTIRENLFTGSYSSGVYSYYPDSEASNPTEYAIATSGLTVVYNNEIITDSKIQSVFGSLEDLLLQADVITFVGYGTAPYSEIHVTDYTYEVVKYVFAEEGVIITQDGYLDLDGEMGGYADFTYNLYDEVGNAISLSDIKKYDVLNILMPCGEDINTADHIDIYVTRKVVEGKVTEKIYIGNDLNSYVISDKQYLAVTALKPGEEGKFFITIDGKIAWKLSNIGELGLLTGIKSETDETSTHYTLTLFTEEGFIDLPVADTLWLEGTLFDDVYELENGGQDVLFGADSYFADVLADADTEEEAQDKINQKIILYKLNSKGKIGHIVVANTSWEKPFYSEMMYKEIYDAQQNTFAGIDTTDSLLIFAPLVKNDTGWNVDISELRIADFSELKDMSTHTKYSGISFVKSSDYQEQLCAFVLTEEIVDVNTNPQEKYIENMSVVSSIGACLDMDENVVSSLTFVQAGRIMTLREAYKEKAVEKAELQIGDIFIYKTDDYGEIVEVNVIYRASSRSLSDYAKSLNIDSDNAAFVFGVVVKFKDRIEIASKVDEEKGTAVTSARFQLHPYLMKATLNCAYYDECMVRNAVKPMSIYSIKETVKGNQVYAIVARLDEYKRICDVVQIAFYSDYYDSDSYDGFNEWKDINNFTNWKLTY